MTTLVCDELITTLSQTINLSYDRIYHFAGLKIKLLMFNAPSGTFTLSIKKSGDTLASADFTSADIKADLTTSNDYAYLYKALNFSLPLKKGSYELVLSSASYTYSDTSFMGWIKSYINVFNEEVDSTVSYADKPFDFLIYENVREDLTR